MSKNVTLAEAKHHPFIVIDTNVLIAEYIGAPTPFQAIPRTQRAAALVSLWEFLRGSPEKPLPREVVRAREKWLVDTGVKYKPFHANVSKTFRSMLIEEQLPGLADSLIAAECLSRNCPLLTHNLKHFGRFDGLMLVTLTMS